ncbi:hypothetical protein COY16_02575 [Candidatus Roizmanbacteria bacterium CG_4_10_14_0_2_um_filter_39_13]|uniref:Uncharacterized protein n=1 Tax=Candidatus Roizmanbacteria bacterium CG_4_10_14_0_2_um_filter_39_13 TaxID=1974825 RepID=A0A2M7TZI0_9BACT|nr:MAG: hypothetical protein COY16_02575 [Candidatus Roizmanbacteria bacterium CG_4_10_14_0_2_um_filter_39_13]
MWSYKAHPIRVSFPDLPAGRQVLSRRCHSRTVRLVILESEAKSDLAKRIGDPGTTDMDSRFHGNDKKEVGDDSKISRLHRGVLYDIQHTTYSSHAKIDIALIVKWI